MTKMNKDVIAVIFCAQRTESDDDGYAKAANDMVALAEKQAGFVGMDTARDEGGFGITTGDNALLLYNSGSIGSTGAVPSTAINSGSAADGIFNSGIINGNISFGDGADAYFGSGNGVVMGVIELDGGNDTAQLGNAGSEFVTGGGFHSTQPAFEVGI